MTTSGQLFPFTSRIVPAIEPVWAAARGASALASVPIRMAARAHDLRKLFMLHSPFSRGEPARSIRARCAPLSLSSGPIPSSAPGGNGSSVRDRIGRAGFGKGAQPQQATIASAAGGIFVLVARPSEMQRGTQFDASPDNLAFLQRDDRRNDFDLRFRPRAQADQLLERTVILRATVRIAGAVFRHRSYINRSCANRLRPAHRHGKKMRIPERDVGYGNRVAARAGCAQLILRYRNALVRERRTANRAKVFEVRDKPIAHAVEIRNFVERAPFALLCALAITGVEQGDV